MIRTKHTEEKWMFPFIEYSPENPDKKLPVIIFLHGAGERGDNCEELNLVEKHGFAKIFSQENQKCLLIMPQCRKNTFWAAKVESIIKFIEQIKESYNIDENRIYLTGLSMGGFGTWYTAMARPDLFAAIAPVCGGGMAWNADVLKMPVWVFHGTVDDAVSVNHSDEMVEALKNAGGDVIYTRLDGVGHNAWDYAYTKELLEWLLKNEK